MGKQKGEGKGKEKGKGQSPCQGNGKDWEVLWQEIEEIQAKLARQGWLREGERDYMEMLLRRWEEEGRPKGKGRGKWKGMRDLGENRGREARVRARLREWARKRQMARGRNLFWGWRRRQRARDEGYLRWQLDFAYTQS